MQMGKLVTVNIHAMNTIQQIINILGPYESVRISNIEQINESQKETRWHLYEVGKHVNKHNIVYGCTPLKAGCTPTGRGPL